MVSGQARGRRDRRGSWLLGFALVGVVVLVGAVGAASAGTHLRWARSGPGMSQLAGPDACYAQRDDESEAAALCRVGKGLMDASEPVVSPDGASVYVAAWGSDAVGVFRRAAATGRLVEFACVSNNGTTGVDGTAGQCADGDAMLGATALAISPDGKNVYAASYASGGIAEFNRDQATGRLRQFGCVRPVATCTGARGLGGASSIAVSPDGTNVYVAAEGADAVTSLARDPATGALKGIGCISDDGTDRMCGKGNALRGAAAVAVSPDGRFVYVAAAYSSSVLTFARDRATGKLTQTGCVLQLAPKHGSCTPGYGIDGPVALAFAPDGRTLFVASYSSNSVAVFARNRNSGVLSERGCVSEPFEGEDQPKDGCVHVAPLVSPTGVAVSPDGLRIYVSGESGLTVFDRDRTTGGLRPAGCVTYANYWDDQVTHACQLGRGVAGATGVTTSPDGKSLYVTASESDAVASFATGVSTALRANLSRRRLIVSLSCPVSHKTPCKGRVTFNPHQASAKPYSLAAGASRQLAIQLSPKIARAAKYRPLSLLVGATDSGRLPVLRAITLGSKPRPRSLRPANPNADPVSVIRHEFRQSFCAPGSATSWCRYLRTIRITRTTLTGVTTLDSTTQAGGAAGHICSALSTLAYANNAQARLTGVRVTGRKNRTLAWRRSLAARCSS
jgi:DNA-binding beta-propeller fold protein YncE